MTEAAADAAAAAAVALVTAAMLCQSAAGEAVEGEKPQELGRRALAIVHDKRKCRCSTSPRKEKVSVPPAKSRCCQPPDCK